MQPCPILLFNRTCPEAAMELFGLHRNDKRFGIKSQNGLIEQLLIFSFGEDLHDKAISISSAANP